MSERIELEKLSPEEFQKLEAELGGKVREICDRACNRANKLLSMYGLKTKMQIVIEQQSELDGSPKKRGRPKKGLIKMANISLLSRLANGVQREVDLSSNTLVVLGLELNGVLLSGASSPAGSTAIGDNNSYSSFTPSAATVKGALSGIDSALVYAASAITALSGDVVSSGPGSVSATIQSNVVSNSKLAQMNAYTIKGNNTGSTANAADLTVIQTNTLLAMPVYNAGNSGTSITIDWNNGPWQQMTLTGNVTVTLSNPVSGVAYILEIVQGSSNYSVTFSGVKWVNGTAYVPSSASGAIDQIALGYNGLTSSYRGIPANGFA